VETGLVNKSFGNGSWMREGRLGSG